MKPLVTVKFNDNIELVYKGQRELLEPSEYYVLMVTDYKRGNTDRRKFFDEAEGWLGLERSGDRIYISKSPSHSSNYNRGQAFVAKVKDPNLCSVLTY